MKKLISTILATLMFATTAFAGIDYTKDIRCKLAYLFVTGSGTTATDSSPVGNNGSFQSSGHPVWSSTVPSFYKSGSPLYSVLSDATSYINTNSTSLLQSGAGPWTLVFWMYPTAYGTTNPHMMDINGDMRLGINFNSNSSTDLYFEYGGSTTLVRDSNTGFYSLNTWTFVAMTWNGSVTATNVHIYTGSSGSISEVTYATTTNGVTLTSDTGDDLYIENRGTDSARYFPGYMADIAIFNQVMDTTDLTNMYYYGLTGTGINTLTAYNTSLYNVHAY